MPITSPDGKAASAVADSRATYETAIVKEAWRLLRISRAIADTWFEDRSDARLSAAERVGQLAASSLRALGMLNNSPDPASAKPQRTDDRNPSKGISSAVFEGEHLTDEDIRNVESALVRRVAGQFVGTLHDSDPHDSDPHDSDPGDFDRANFDRANFDRA